MRVLPGEPGRPKKLAGFWTDLTVRHEAEEELRRSGESLHSLLAHPPQNIIRKDRDGRFTFTIERLFRTIGAKLGANVVSQPKRAAHRAH
jgi:PAS domain-containing protein